MSMQITPIIEKTIVHRITHSHPQNKQNLYLFNTVSDLLKKHQVTATLHTGDGIIDMPAPTGRLLDELKKLGIHYEKIEIAK